MRTDRRGVWSIVFFVKSTINLFDQFNKKLTKWFSKIAGTCTTFITEIHYIGSPPLARPGLVLTTYGTHSPNKLAVTALINWSSRQDKILLSMTTWSFEIHVEYS